MKRFLFIFVLLIMALSSFCESFRFFDIVPTDSKATVMTKMKALGWTLESEQLINGKIRMDFVKDEGTYAHIKVKNIMIFFYEGKIYTIDVNFAECNSSYDEVYKKLIEKFDLTEKYNDLYSNICICGVNSEDVSFIAFCNLPVHREERDNKKIKELDDI